MAATANGTSGVRVGANRPSTPPRVIALGFYDGPTDGVIQLGNGGPVFRFTMPDEDAQLASDESARVYHFLPLPPDALERVAAAISPHMTPAWPVWTPIWQFTDEAAADAVRAAVDTVLAEAGPAEWQVTTPAYWTFEEFDARPLAAAGAAR